MLVPRNYNTSARTGRNAWIEAKPCQVLKFSEFAPPPKRSRFLDLFLWRSPSVSVSPRSSVCSTQLETSEVSETPEVSAFSESTDEERSDFKDDSYESSEEWFQFERGSLWELRQRNSPKGRGCSKAASPCVPQCRPRKKKTLVKVPSKLVAFDDLPVIDEGARLGNGKPRWNHKRTVFVSQDKNSTGFTAIETLDLEEYIAEDKKLKREKLKREKLGKRLKACVRKLVVSAMSPGYKE